MKKNLTIIILLMVLMALPGCGKSKTEDVNAEGKADSVTSVQEQEDASASVTDPIVTPEPAEEAVKEPASVEDTSAEPENVVALCYKDSTVSFGEFDARDQINAYYEYEEYTPYYVGRGHEESIHFLKNNKNQEDEVLYLGLPMYLPEHIDAETAYVEIDDSSVGKIEGEELIALKEGIFNLSCYDEKMELIETKRFVCTTFNDSKDGKERNRTMQGDIYTYVNAWEPEYWKASVHTIMDMCFLLQVRDFKYDFAGEPKFTVIDNQPDAIDNWVWTADAETIFDISRGVCIEVAQLAVYMLADDYEDWGVVMVEGNQGHIFNWFYEDGNYYVFDFTKVISDNQWNKLSFGTYVDYSSDVKIFSTIDQIKDWCMSEKVDLKENYTIYMYSCKGHDYIACNVNTGMGDSNAALHAEGDYSEITIGFQDVVMEDLIVLWENPNSCKINWRSYAFEEMNPCIAGGIYNYKKKLDFRHKY